MQKNNAIICNPRAGISSLQKWKFCDDWILFPQFFSTFAHFSYKLPTWVIQPSLGLIFSRWTWGLILPRIRPPPPVLYSVVTPFGNIIHHQAHPKTPLFLAWTWKWAKWTTVWEIQISTGQNVWKVLHTFQTVGKKKLSVNTMCRRSTRSTCLESSDSTGFSPRIRRISPSGKIRENEGNIRYLSPKIR